MEPERKSENGVRTYRERKMRLQLDCQAYIMICPLLPPSFSDAVPFLFVAFALLS